MRKRNKMNNKRFIDNGDETITDTKTNLIWQKSDDGVKRTFKEAKEYAKSLTLAGKKWRLPAIDGLLSIVDYERINPSIDPIFKCHSDFYWSGSTSAFSPDYAWGVDFSNGHYYWYYKDSSNYVRCVHDSAI